MIVYTFLNYYDFIEIDVYKYKRSLIPLSYMHLISDRPISYIFFNSSNIQIQFRYVIYLSNFNNVYIMPLALEDIVTGQQGIFDVSDQPVVNAGQL